MKKSNKTKLFAVLFSTVLFCTLVPLSEGALLDIFKGKQNKEEEKTEEISSEDATELFSKKKYLKAREAFKKLVEKDSDDLDDKGMLAWCEFMLDNHVAAQNIFRKIANKDNGNFDGQLGMAWTHIKLGNYKKAIENYETAIELASDSDYAGLYNNLALAYNSQGNDTKAIEIYEARLGSGEEIFNREQIESELLETTSQLSSCQ